MKIKHPVLLQAATEAIKIAKAKGIFKLKILTDSKFLMNCVYDPGWYKKWKLNDWKKSDGETAKNAIELEAYDQAMKKGPTVLVKYQHVPGHRGIKGNEKADALARAGARKS